MWCNHSTKAARVSCVKGPEGALQRKWHFKITSVFCAGLSHQPLTISSLPQTKNHPYWWQTLPFPCLASLYPSGKTPTKATRASLSSKRFCSLIFYGPTLIPGHINSLPCYIVSTRQESPWDQDDALNSQCQQIELSGMNELCSSEESEKNISCLIRKGQGK